MSKKAKEEAVNPCPCCGENRLQTLVCGDYDASDYGGEPKPTCTVPIFIGNNRRRYKPCNKPAVIVDALFPVEWSHNRCDEHTDWPKPMDKFDAQI